jgi:hypothetical protein
LAVKGIEEKKGGGVGHTMRGQYCPLRIPYTRDCSTQLL